MEVLGAVAGASQLAVYLAKAISSLKEVHERLKHAPETIKKHADNIKALLDTIRHIEQQKLVSTILLSHLESTNTQASRLGLLLKKVFGDYTHPSWRKRYWKLARGSQENRILFALQDLEREKSGLALCLASTNTELLLKHRSFSESRMADREQSMQTNLPPSPPLSFADGGDPPSMDISKETRNRKNEIDNAEKPANVETPGSPQQPVVGECKTLNNEDAHCGGGHQNIGVFDTKNETRSCNISNKKTTCTAGVQNAGYSNSWFGPPGL